MSEAPKKKKMVIKKKGSGGTKGKKPVIKLNKGPAPDEAEETVPPTEEVPKDAEKQAEPADQAEAKPEAAPKEEAPAAPKEEAPAAQQEEPKEEAAPAEKKEEAAFKFFCVYCGQKLSASPSMTGRKISCPSCGHKIEVPEAP